MFYKHPSVNHACTSHGRTYSENHSGTSYTSRYLMNNACSATGSDIAISISCQIHHTSQPAVRCMPRCMHSYTQKHRYPYGASIRRQDVLSEGYTVGSVNLLRGACNTGTIRGQQSGPVNSVRKTSVRRWHEPLRKDVEGGPGTFLSNRCFSLFWMAGRTATSTRAARTTKYIVAAIWKSS